MRSSVQNNIELNEVFKIDISNFSVTTSEINKFSFSVKLKYLDPVDSKANNSNKHNTNNKNNNSNTKTNNNNKNKKLSVKTIGKKHIFSF